MTSGVKGTSKKVYGTKKRAKPTKVAVISDVMLEAKVPQKVKRSKLIKDLPPGADHFQAFLRGCDLTNIQRKELYGIKAKSGKSELEMEQFVHDLPHRYGRKLHVWARAFFECVNKQNFLVAANQVGKSTIQMCTDIDWATNQSLWPKLWAKKPNMFFYLYPDRKTSTQEFENKWVPDCLPRGALKESDVWGWEAIYDGKFIDHISFRSGVSIYFKTYSQQVKNLQAGTCFKISTDEELPVELYDELMFRLQAVGGYFSMGFTCTQGQEYWRLVREERGGLEELPDAFKQQVSLYDCEFFEDGSPDLRYTAEKIQKIKARCRNKREILKRVEGRFVRDTGLMYPHFEIQRHYFKRPEGWAVPSDWLVYVGIDPGTGRSDEGRNNHPAAIIFMCIDPQYMRGIIFDSWRGDVEETASNDILKKYREMCLKNKCAPTQVFYDWHNRDLKIVFSRSGVSMTRANKNRDEGHDLMNTLFSKEMLIIWETDDNVKLVHELVSLDKATGKTMSKDDLCDAVRYTVTGVPWDFESVESLEKVIEMRALEEAVIKKSGDLSKEDSVFDDVDAQRRQASISGRKRHRLEEGEASWDEELNQEIRDFNDLLD